MTPNLEQRAEEIVKAADKLLCDRSSWRYWFMTKITEALRQIREEALGQSHDMSHPDGFRCLECYHDGVNEGAKLAYEEAAKVAESHSNYAYVGRNPCVDIASKIRALASGSESK